jgi:hypothetical protein
MESVRAMSTADAIFRRLARRVAYLTPRCRVRIDDTRLRTYGLYDDRDPFWFTCSKIEQFQQFAEKNKALLTARTRLERDIVPPCEFFCVLGYCAVCQRPAAFQTDFLYSERTPSGERTPNWRERLICTHCRLPSRQRAVIDFLSLTTALPKQALLYLPESATPFFRAVKRLWPNALGSALLRDATPFGKTNARGVRNENLTQLTFADASLEAMCVSEVLEHVPNYRKALAECYRCLKSSSVIVITVPFLLDSAETVVRARVTADGTLEHLMRPEYHGDPLDKRGVLCYYHFGWDLLEVLAQVGFINASLHFYWSAVRGYLGGTQFLISARKSGP